jgi:glucokinase
MTRHVLAGDIGGTKTALAIVSAESGPRRPIHKATFPSASYGSLDAIVREFLAGKDIAIARASIGVSGPVVDGRCRVTNLPWLVDARLLSAPLGGAPVTLLNDLESIAHAVPYLQPSDIETLNAGRPARHGALGVVAPGTGLGEAFLVWDGKRYTPCPSEGGHTDFAPVTPLEMELLAYLMPRLGHVSYERVIAGIGIPNIYQFLRDTGRAAEPEWLRRKIAALADPTPAIVEAARDGKTPLCTQAMEMWVSILGSECGNLALKVMATGGVYIGGGIPPRVLPLLRGPALLKAFTSKGRLGRVLVNTPVHVILAPDVAMFGAAQHALAWEG